MRSSNNMGLGIYHQHINDTQLFISIMGPVITSSFCLSGVCGVGGTGLGSTVAKLSGWGSLCPWTWRFSKFSSGSTWTKVPVRTGCNQHWTHGSCNKVVAMARHIFAQINLMYQLHNVSGSGGSAQSNSCLDNLFFGFLQCVFTWDCLIT